MINSRLLTTKNLEFFETNGFVKVKILNKKEINTLKKTVRTKLNNILKKNKINNSIYSLENYHKIIKEGDTHKVLMNPDTRFIKLDKKIEKRMYINLENFFYKLWGHKKIEFTWLGDIKNKNQIKNHATGFRIARPSVKNELKNKNDASGVHVDKNCGGTINKENNMLFTVWIPLIGFSKNYTLNIAPKSHKKDHSKFIYRTKRKITILISKNYIKKFRFQRQKLKIGEALVLNSNLLHGASHNFGKKSRLSLDCRVVNKNKFNF